MNPYGVGSGAAIPVGFMADKLDRPSGTDTEATPRA